MGGDKGTRAVKLIAFSEADPALILFPNFPQIFGVMMPMRTPPMDAALPAFMKEVLEPSRKTKRKAA